MDTTAPPLAGRKRTRGSAPSAGATGILQVAEELEFEYAAKLRDEIKDLERQLQEVAS